MHETRLRNWRDYNLFKTVGQRYVPQLLDGVLAQTVWPERPVGAGRPVSEDRERFFLRCATQRTLLGDSSRDAIGHLPWWSGPPPPPVHFNTLLHFLRRPRTTLLIQAALEESTRPLWGHERVFACDATGLGIPFAPRWHELRALKHVSRKDYVKLHLCCGTTSNLVVAAHVTGGRAGDAPVFPQLARQTARHFLLEEISGDTAYCSRDNCRVADQLGATPYFWPRKDATVKAQGVKAWHNMIQLFQQQPEEFRVHYHQRSNSETVFGVMKWLFGGFLFAKDPLARFNEALLKVLCYNAVVLVRSSMELGIDLAPIEAARTPGPAYPLAPRGEWVEPGWAPGHCVEVAGSP